MDVGRGVVGRAVLEIPESHRRVCAARDQEAAVTIVDRKDVHARVVCERSCRRIFIGEGEPRRRRQASGITVAGLWSSSMEFGIQRHE